jgi:hypothetical protein
MIYIFFVGCYLKFSLLESRLISSWSRHITYEIQSELYGRLAQRE